MESLSELLVVHTQLDARFAEHQYALLHFDFKAALELLEEYRSMLSAHMADEEDVLLPIYSERAVIEKGGAVKLFLDEHEKMRQHIAMFMEVTERLMSETRPEPVLITLLDRESFYKRLSDHHDLRESGILYPALDGITTQDERKAIFAKLAVGSTLS